MPVPPMPVPQMSVQQLRAALDAGEDLVLLDVREAVELQLASLPGALHIPMGQVTARMITDLDPDRRIVVMCHHGIRSWQVALYLHGMDFADVHNLAGGIDAWSREIDPSVPRY